jgi:hypothetical protein
MMTLEQRIAAMVQDWRDKGQHDHAEWLRREMWALLKPFAPARAFSAGAA